MKRDVLWRGVSVKEKQREEEIRCIAKRGRRNENNTKNTKQRSYEKWGEMGLKRWRV